ncbi:SCO family protein [Puniceibacterium sp. IMCC21224]|uniref:SCO family protein n=1 Tax=Puniceibacterium sp. IMCC21224 TaxID=1618204 RepID=UPI00065D710C|nr:SCO family protein [Puniceibacterium sp. IMCC21224]KMK65286.1 uncharacterized protein SCO1/SenC/PrrC [Puniceibacterium sp. IMCC21224]
MLRIAAISASVAITALMVGTWYVTAPGGGGDVFANCRSGQVAGDIGGPFTLINGDGETVTDKDVITRPTLLYFGYTFCPDICPIDVARNAEVTDIMEERGETITPVFITIDPKRDTPDVVKAYAANMHERMIGLTGSPEQIRTASQAYRTYSNVHDTGDAYYLVDHSTFTYLVLPEQGFVDYFRRDVSADEMANRVSCFLENA